MFCGHYVLYSLSCVVSGSDVAKTLGCFIVYTYQASHARPEIPEI